MTNEEAIKIIIDMANALRIIQNTPQGKAIKMAIKALEQEPKTGWIPISERLPEENKEVLLCYQDGDMIVGYKRGEWWCRGNYSILVSINAIIAWMPLPKAYKAESEVHDADSN